MDQREDTKIRWEGGYTKSIFTKVLRFEEYKDSHNIQQEKLKEGMGVSMQRMDERQETRNGSKGGFL